jgi:asparagine synthase (glutamine-hydrolysing)
MCGIAGYYEKGDTFREGHLDAALDRLGHRGPDDRGRFTDGRLALGQTRLSIIDLAGGRQPLLSEDGQLVLVANGEIYNFVELREDLEKMGHNFLTRSDSEVILHCYAEYGDDFIGHLNGMFAFALFDRSRNRLILARDRLGIKPLFLASTPEGIVFASELKAIFPLLDRDPEVNAKGLLQYLQNQFATGRTTIIKGVERILPGEAVCIEAGEVAKRWSYWSALDVEPLSINYPEAQEEFDRIMEEVMIEHMRSDVPFGLFLSGGVDSALLLAVLSRLRDEPIRTFSVGFPGTSLTNELLGARAMASLFGSRHEEITPSVEEIYGSLPLTVWAADDLMRDYANLPTCLLSAAAARKLKVVFSGEGGDEIFAGYGRYRTHRTERAIKNLLSPGSGGFRTRGTFRGRWPGKLFGRALREAGEEARRPVIEAWSATPLSWSDLQRMQYTDLVTAMPDNLLVKADRMMMAWGLEGRVPFLDHRVVEFGLSLPDSLKVAPGQGKLFLKRWASRYIPEDHLYRKKKGFHVPVGEWFDDRFLAGLGQTLPDSSGVREWFDPAGVKRLVGKCAGSSLLIRMVWAILHFSIWHSFFIEGNGVRPPERIDPLRIIGKEWK